MRATLFLSTAIILLILGASRLGGQTQALPEENFFTKSLHYTNRGIEFVYSKEHGGLERLTGLSATEAGCLKSKCHVRTCDACHKKDVDGKVVYSVEQARTETACQTCHPVDKDSPDVHVRSGMKCMDCHTTREIHGDGVAYDTYMKPGFFDARCENCHTELSQTASHTVHGGKLDCRACHAREASTCFNCHIDTRLAGGKDSSIEQRGMLFLVNHDGKVKLANLLSYVYGQKTMITLAPVFPHSIVKEGRACEACHATSNVRAVKKGTLELFRWRDGAAKSPEGVIPVIEGMKWNMDFLAREGDTWVPLAKPAEPLINFSGYCSPLSREQMANLESKQRQGGEK